ncbi:carbohydrate sulfotransferase 10-like [Watersipora subatra]|uniref:carbohydrate sulfotransferase 10-like n=1 Tax=Watersipora subatra TaxID=2589382 RepID=UPI00355B0616
MGFRSCFTSPSSTIVTIAIFLQIVIFSVYINRKYVDSVEIRQPVKATIGDVYRPAMASKSNDSERGEPSEEFIKTHRERVNKLREFCADFKHDLTKGFPKYDRLEDVLPSWNWITSPHHQLFYCATPKCASTTWKTYLMNDLKINWTIDTHQAATNLGVATMFPKEMPAFKDFLEFYRPANRLIIVRNPWARLVSAYEDKIVDSHWTLKKLCIAYEDYKSVAAVTFDVFIDCLTHSMRDVVWNPHVNPLTSLCGVCQMDYNIIVKLEEMYDAEPYIFKKLKFSTKPKYNPLRKGKYNKTYASHYKIVSQENIQRLYDIYKSDIEIFSYPSSPFDE